MNTETFIIESRKKHGDKFDYSKLPERIDPNSKITIISIYK